MSKGLPRSMSRGDALKQEVIKQSFAIEKTVTVSATGAAVGFGSVVIGGFPQGNILFLGAVSYLKLSGSGSDANLTADWAGDYGVGTTPAADATISDTDVDIIASTAVAAATAEVSALTRGEGGGALCGVILNNTDGSLELNLNVLVDAAEITNDESVVLTASGAMHIAYIVLGDD